MRLDLARGGIGWSIGNNLWLVRSDRWQIWGVFSLDRWTGIVMYTEGSCFGLDLIVDEIKVSSLMVVLSLGGINDLSRSACPFGSGGMVWLLTVGAPPHPYLLPNVLADHFQVESRSVASYTGACDSRNSTGHSIELCEHPPAAHAVENAG